MQAFHILASRIKAARACDDICFSLDHVIIEANVEADLLRPFSSCRLLGVWTPSAVVGAAARRAPDGLLHFVTWVHNITSVGSVTGTFFICCVWRCRLVGFGASCSWVN